MSAVDTSPDEGVPLLVVISGPSGVGKDTVLERMKASDAPYHFAVTATARPKRENEVDGVDYIFVSRDEFQDMIVNDELLEWAKVYGNLYGVPKSPVREALARGQDVILKIDVQGGDNIRRLVPGAVYVFLAPPDMAELEQRLTQRKTESSETLKVRLETAAREIEEAEKYDYVVVNRTGRLDEAVEEINAIIRRERARPGRERIVI
ncbi:MAG: guanylate kinase [Dehalococcoidia bacterium]|nr:guanylate kinase [Dehalococcoidia bacterium]